MTNLTSHRRRASSLDTLRRATNLILEGGCSDYDLPPQKRFGSSDSKRSINRRAIVKAVSNAGGSAKKFFPSVVTNTSEGFIFVPKVQQTGFIGRKPNHAPRELKGGYLNSRRPITKQVTFQSPDPSPEREVAPSVPQVELVNEEEENPSVQLFWDAPFDGGSEIQEYKVKSIELGTKKVGIMLTGNPEVHYKS